MVAALGVRGCFMGDRVMLDDGWSGEGAMGIAGSCSVGTDK